MTPPTNEKLQRWLDLIHCLLAHRLPVTFEQIEAEVVGYRNGTKAAKKRTFERDKDELRRLGVPIETEGNEGDNESAYRLRASDFYLPYLAVASERGARGPRRVDADGYRALAGLTFDADELQMIAEAGARAMQLGDSVLAGEASSALRKLAFDLPLDAAHPVAEVTLVPPRARALERTLTDLHGALIARKRVAIDYKSMSTGAVTTRTVEPYGLCFLSGNWYLVARDVDQDAIRNFRASRILSAKVNAARPGTPDYAIADGFNLKEHAQVREAWMLGDGDVIEATVAFAPSSGPARAAMQLGAEVPGRASERRFSVRRSDVFARWLLSFAGQATPLSPPSLVEEYRDLARATRALYADAAKPRDPFSGVMAE